MIPNVRYSEENAKRSKKTICDCVMCLNDDQKNVELEKDNPYETKAIKSLFPLKYPQVC